jgi:hypothetical protein
VLPAGEGPEIPEVLKTPIVEGNAEVGATLSANPGVYRNGATSYTYQWNRAAIESNSKQKTITGATSSTYKASGADLNMALRVEVTPRNAQGAGKKRTSGPSAIVRP